MCRLLFLHEGKVVWQGITQEFMTSTKPIVQQVITVVEVLKPLEFRLWFAPNFKQ
jgi:ABC-type transporter Mla maintaining outer membrane lipid asymmetry ATPase subunit MlaF